MSFPPPSLQPLAKELAELLISRKETVSIVETACGGLISASLLSIPGTSACFKGPTTAICLKLASRVRASLQTTYALAESGTTGPSRPAKYRAEIKGPGYCALAIVGPEGVEWEKELEVEQEEGRERGENMVSFAEGALKGLVEVVKARGAGKL
ncbi:hypothetical protein MNV49_007543 [Pseudohyphozyma bogoriensis]|nr:hypothetical protein MNV49_007543 [Pseudohyphozyma bogoriensis]